MSLRDVMTTRRAAVGAAGGRMSAERHWLARREHVLWIAVIAIGVSMQWPMIKGTYYRMFNPEARQSRIAWHSTLAAAREEARRTGRPILADFNASWCAPCITMKHEVWPDDDVEREVGASYVPVMIDVDRDPSAVDQYHIGGVPTVLVLDADGRLLRSAGYLPVSGMLRFLRDNGKTDASF